MSRVPPGTDSYLDRFADHASTQGWSPAVALGALAGVLEARLAGGSRVLDTALLLRTDLALDADVAPPPQLCSPDLLGEAHQALLDRRHRRRRGVFYTPREITERLLGAATHEWRHPQPVSVCDPACGGGAFLLATARWLEAQGHSRDAIVGEHLGGVDLDPLAVAVTDASLRLWAAETGARPTPRLAVADALLDAVAAVCAPPGGVDLVVGNPPFQSQLQAATARDRDLAARLEERFGSAVAGYADTATAFLLASMHLVGPGGRVALVLPESFLAARDARPVRDAVASWGAVVGLWLPRAHLFDASVDVCIPVIERGARAGGVTLWSGATLEPAGVVDAPAVGDASGTWGPIAAGVLRLPDMAIATTPTVGSLATATAGFRDQFYGLVPFVHEVDDITAGHRQARLVTSGRIEPGRLTTADRPTKFAGSRFHDPRVDLTELERSDPDLARWGGARLRPKLVVATQTKVLEAAVDETGSWWPSVPVVSVECDATACWPLAAVLNSPVASLWAYRRFAGSALSRDAIKVAARQVLEIPLPADAEAWEDGAELLRRSVPVTQRDEWNAAMGEYGAAMCTAYGVGPEVLGWWLERLPSA